ncbi:MAG: cell division protein FtsL [Zoogloeaceae bacterium]|jgi:cell division protein FtsL|nr:cell division protein FtsL [Zoogloeaceae bacterium]
MLRFNLVLLLLSVCSALGLVTARHKSTRLYQAIQAETAQAEQLDTEFNQLKANLSSLAAHSRIERIARERLRMHVPLLHAGTVPRARATEAR